MAVLCPDCLREMTLQLDMTLDVNCTEPPKLARVVGFLCQHRYKAYGVERVCGTTAALVVR